MPRRKIFEEKGRWLEIKPVVRLLTEKQEVVLATINRFGVISLTQVAEYLKGQISHVSVYSTKDKLLKLGMIKAEKIGKPLILYIKPTGVEYLGNTLTPFTKINFSTLQHQLTMNDCILALKRLTEKRGDTFNFISERELRSQYLDQNFSPAERRNATLLKRVPDRIPDFVVEDDEGGIAYEVELTRKTSKRYLRKMERYKDEILNGRYRQVRYLCENEKIRQAVTEQAQKADVPPHMLQIEMIGRLLQVGEDE